MLQSVKQEKAKTLREELLFFVNLLLNWICQLTAYHCWQRGCGYRQGW
jgi:hypothetical protein